MKVILTGSTGFVGGNLLKFLSKGTEIIQLNLRTKLIAELEVDVTAIIHLAGKAHDFKNTSRPEEYYQVNTELTKQIFDSFLTSDSSVFIYMSSVKAVADSVVGILNEDCVPNPQT
ncbi:MAG: NAD-dependent epimerase/dehydratase family protein, partial [Lutibacter sp.]|nr:NAD-dependent epimerase/dehydratase family protein [Lutibacter sp.]